MLCSIIYIFKLIYYSCFDFRKGFLDTWILLLQNNTNNNKNYLNNFSYAKTIAFFTLYLFSILFYIIVKFFILKNYLFYYYTPETHVNNYNFLTNIIFTQSYLIKIYYSFYIVLIYILLLWNWRKNYFFIEKRKLIVSITGFVLIYFIFGRIMLTHFYLFDSNLNIVINKLYWFYNNVILYYNTNFFFG
jgi:hypothetical protein